MLQIHELWTATREFTYNPIPTLILSNLSLFQCVLKVKNRKPQTKGRECLREVLSIMVFSMRTEAWKWRQRHWWCLWQLWETQGEGILPFVSFPQQQHLSNDNLEQNTLTQGTSKLHIFVSLGPRVQIGLECYKAVLSRRPQVSDANVRRLGRIRDAEMEGSSHYTLGLLNMEYFCKHANKAVSRMYVWLGTDVDSARLFKKTIIRSFQEQF